MAKGDVFPSERREFTEPTTGVRVIQLTDQPCFNANPYYNQEGFIGGSERYVFRSNRNGAVLGDLFMADVSTGKMVQLTQSRSPVAGDWLMDSNGSSQITVDPKRGIVYFCRDRQMIGLDVETLDEKVVAESPEGCTSLGGLDLSSCGRYLIAGCSPEGAPHWDIPGMRGRHSSEAMLVLIDVQETRQTIIYHGPSPENPATPDSHVFISRDDPSYPFFGSYSRRQPSGAKTIWAMQVDLHNLHPKRDPMLLFDQRPSEGVNHYYPAPNAHVESVLHAAEAYDRHGAPIGRNGHQLAMLLDVDLANGSVSRWAFPGHAPIHCKCNNAVDLWAGDSADPGFLWFAGRNLEVKSYRQPHYWAEANAWIGVFRKFGPYLEVRPLVRHDTDWPSCHPHPVFSPDDKWIAYRSGDRNQTQIFLAEAVWPKWFC